MFYFLSGSLTLTFDFFQMVRTHQYVHHFAQLYYPRHVRAMRRLNGLQHSSMQNSRVFWPRHICFLCRRDVYQGGCDGSGRQSDLPRWNLELSWYVHRGRWVCILLLVVEHYTGGKKNISRWHYRIEVKKKLTYVVLLNITRSWGSCDNNINNNNNNRIYITP